MTDIAEDNLVQHVYDFAKLDRAPQGATSLAVTPRRLLSGDTLETGKSSTVGAVLSGRSIICTLVSEIWATVRIGSRAIIRSVSTQCRNV